MRMDNKIFSETIRDLRKSKGMSQEQLSEKLGISVQAVSKWECAQSYPDIELLPIIADIMEVSIDYLLRGGETSKTAGDLTGGRAGNNKGKNFEIGKEFNLPDDDVLRIVQFKGRKLLRQDNYDPQIKIPLYIEDGDLEDVDTVEIWGSANIEGNITGSVNAGGGVKCGNVGDYVEAGGGVNCGCVGDYVEARGGVNCGPVGDYVEAGGGVNCGPVGDYVEAGGGVKCGNVGDYVEASGDVNCTTVGGDVTAGRNVECEDVAGDVTAGGKVTCKNVEGDVTAGSSVEIEDINN